MNLWEKISQLKKIESGLSIANQKLSVLWSETVEMTFLQERQEEILGASCFADCNVDIVA